MPANLIVRAQVVDIRADKPRSNELFLVDTNVWNWVAYPQAGVGAQGYQLQWYPHYINQCLVRNAQLCKTALIYSELAHLIEDKEWQIYQNTHHLMTLKKKDFRHDYPSERAKVIAEIQTAWQLIQAIAPSTLEILLNDVFVAQADARMAAGEALDGYDLFTVESMLQHQITHIITDDSDFVTAQGIVVFTANNTALKSAKQQGRLLVR